MQQRNKRMNQTCKHNNDKMKCEQCYSEKFPWCDKCNKSKVSLNTVVPTGNSGTREGGRDSVCKCSIIEV